MKPGQEVKILQDDWISKYRDLTKVYEITDYDEESNQYRITGLWFKADEIAPVSPETHPEMYL